MERVILSVIIVLFPAIIGYVSGRICNVQDTSGSAVNFRPPPKVFGLVWAILYVLIGVSWWFAVYKPNISSTVLVSIFYILLNLALCSWIYFYSCRKEKINGIYTLAISITLALLCYTVGNRISQILIVPLIGWLLLATLINVTEVNSRI